jgi:hypothetical protein
MVGHNFLGHSLNKGQKIFFSHNDDFMGIKYAEFNVDFKKYKFTLVTKGTYKCYFSEKRITSLHR